MTDSIFRTWAPQYWIQGLPVVAVEGKAPVQKGWTGYLGAIPSDARQVELLEKFSTKNIGLLLGAVVSPDKILVAFDVDDDRLVRLALKLLGLNRADRKVILSGKRGKKGATIFALAPKSMRSTVIRGTGDLGNIDFLAAGKMTVMPPSIHPETGKAYETLGTPLLETNLVELPETNSGQISLFKMVIGSELAEILISGQPSHDAGVALSATLVQAGASDDEITDIFQGLLPENYEGNSLKELPEWIASARDKAFDQNESQGGTLTKALIELAINSGMELFNDGDNNAYAALPHLGSGVAVRIGSNSFALWLRHLAHSMLDRPVSVGPLREAIATLEAIAIFDKPAHPVHVRIAGDSKCVVVDHGGNDMPTVQIDANGCRLASNSDLKFVRGSGFQALPDPVVVGSLRDLLSFLGLDEQNFLLLMAFLISALKPEGPYFVLLVEGEQGSGKSFFCEIIKRILDPNLAIRLRLPDKPQDLMIQAKEYRLLNFDNASGMSAEMSDVLCSLATGGGISVRKLYSDGDLYVMNYSRPFVINGIGGYANRPDLLERGIPIRLKAMPEDGRRTEAELLEEFEEALPAVLGNLYAAVAHGIRNFESTDPPRHLRMADAARWIKACEEGLGEEEDALIDAISSAQHELMLDRIDEDPLFMKLRGLVRQKPFDDYIGTLFIEISDESN